MIRIWNKSGILLKTKCSHVSLSLSTNSDSYTKMGNPDSAGLISHISKVFTNTHNNNFTFNISLDVDSSIERLATHPGSENKIHTLHPLFLKIEY